MATCTPMMRKIIYAAILTCMLRIIIGMKKLNFELPAYTSSNSNINITTHASTLSNEEEDSMQWIDTTGVELYKSHGDPTTCKDVIYTADSRLPTVESSFVNASWGALSFIIRKFDTFNSTCAAYFHISDKAFGGGGIGGGATLHSVWGRLPATALAMSYFPNARILLYMDTDAMLADAKYNPRQMYDSLVNEHHHHHHHHQRDIIENDIIASSESPTPPSLIVNKPTKGWLCKNQCDKFGLGHGCFNSGALLWRRSRGAQLILRAWWESRLDNVTQNFQHGTEMFFGWSGQFPFSDKMSEQNRLMYVYHTIPEVKRRVLPVPRQAGTASNTTSCPEEIDEAHTPCLQDDESMYTQWNTSKASCFINHFAKEKDRVHKVFKKILESGEKDMIRERLYPLVQQTQPDLAGNITDLMLELDNSKLLHLLENPEALNFNVQLVVDFLELEVSRHITDTHN